MENLIRKAKIGNIPEIAKKAASSLKQTLKVMPVQINSTHYKYNKGCYWTAGEP